jgi:hypothetical protein
VNKDSKNRALRLLANLGVARVVEGYAPGGTLPMVVTVVTRELPRRAVAPPVVTVPGERWSVGVPEDVKAVSVLARRQGDPEQANRHVGDYEATPIDEVL